MAPVVNLKTTVIPRSLMRATVLGDLMKNFGANDSTIRTAQEGFANGHICGLQILGRDHANYVRDEAYLDFDVLATDDNVQIDVSGGRSMIEAVSVKFAHGVAYSVDVMRRKGLVVTFSYQFRHHVWSDPALFQATLARYGLVMTDKSRDYEPGTAMRTLFTVNPDFDRGISYRHATSWRVR
jgi:hypothetical protein